MLSLPIPCRSFRDTFDPERPGDPRSDHRASCADCAAWAERLAALPAAREERPLPGALAARLRAIPRQEAVCRDVDRLMDATRAGVRGGPVDLAARRHLETCTRCAPVYQAVAAAMRAETRPRAVPRRLATRLRSLARVPRIPRPLLELDLRWAVAASVMMGLLLQPVAPTLAAALRETDAAVTASTTRWIDEGAASSRVALGRVGGFATGSFEEGAERLARYGDTWKELASRTRRTFAGRPVSPDDDPSTRGDRDGD